MDATKDEELAGPSSPAQEKVAQISELGDKHEQDRLEGSRYKPQLRRNRSVFTLLFQTLAIAAIPFGEGGPLLDTIYGGGPLSIFVGWIVVCLLCECIALSLAELASRYPTSAGPYYWSYRVAGSSKAAVSFVTCWVWLVGNWTITLSVNFGFASIAAASISMFRPGWTTTSWQLLLILYAVLLGAFVICTFGNRYLPQVDMICALWTVLTILVILIALSVKAGAGRHSAAYALSHYDSSLSGWSGFSFFIGLLAPAYTFCAIGMVASMAEECNKPAVEVPWALSLCVPVGCITGLFFILPICFTIPPLEDVINAPVGQVVPYIFHVVMDSPGGGLALTVLVLIVNFCASLSITVCASRASWAIARDDAIPLSRLWARVHPGLGVPVWSLTFGTVIQMLLGLINLGSSEAFTAFVSAGVIALAVSYAIPIALSLLNGRREVSQAPWTCGPIFGPIVNVIALCWIAFELVLFSMPTSLPVTSVSMNYGSVVVVGFMAISAFWYAVHARKSFKGPLAAVEMI